MFLYLLLLRVLGNGTQGLQGKAGRRGVIQTLEEVKERSCCCLQLPNGRGWRRWSQTPQRCTGRGGEATGTCWNTAISDSIQRKEISTKRVVKGRRPQKGREISVPTPNLTEHPALSGRACEEVAGPETSRWPFLLSVSVKCLVCFEGQSLFAHNVCFKYLALTGGEQYQEIVC